MLWIASAEGRKTDLPGDGGQDVISRKGVGTAVKPSARYALRNLHHRYYPAAVCIVIQNALLYLVHRVGRSGTSPPSRGSPINPLHTTTSLQNTFNYYMSTTS